MVSMNNIFLWKISFPEQTYLESWQCFLYNIVTQSGRHGWTLLSAATSSLVLPRLFQFIGSILVWYYTKTQWGEVSQSSGAVCSLGPQQHWRCHARWHYSPSVCLVLWMNPLPVAGWVGLFHFLIIRSFGHLGIRLAELRRFSKCQHTSLYDILCLFYFWERGK